MVLPEIILPCCDITGWTQLIIVLGVGRRWTQKRQRPFDGTRLKGGQSRSQRPRSFWLATGIATSGQVQLRQSAIHGLPVTLRMLRVKSDKSDWFWAQSIVFTQSHSKPECRWTWPGVPISSAWHKGPLGTRLKGGFHGSAHVCIIYSSVHAFWHRPRFSLFMNQS